MSQRQHSPSQLTEHTLQFALAVREFGKRIPMTVANVEDLKQLIRASGAIGATYLASENASNRTDFLRGVKQCATETKATHYWLQLLDTQGATTLENQRAKLMQIAQDLMGLFAEIHKTSSVS